MSDTLPRGHQPGDEHRKAKAIARHRVEVQDIKQRAAHWRLIDCSEETLEQMRHALIEEMEALEFELSRADSNFLLYVEAAQPLETETARREIDRLAEDWEMMRKHLKEIDDAILERHLRSRLAARLGGEKRLNALDATVFVSILVAIALTIIEFTIPLPAAVIASFVAVDTAICVLLIFDFFLRLSQSEDKEWYLRRYWIDLASSIPFYEALRFGRLVRIMRFGRLLRLLRLGRALRMLAYSFRGLDTLSRTFQLNLLKRAVFIAIGLLIFGALSIRLFENAQGAALAEVSESLWWSFTTVVTGGFADLYNPNSTLGRMLTVGLVLLGLTVTGIFTASLTSVLVGDDAERLQQNQQDIEIRLEDFGNKLDLLSEETNRGLIAMETVAPELSNQTSHTRLAEVLVGAMIHHFEAVQASVHLLGQDQLRLNQVASQGNDAVAPPPSIPVGQGLEGRVIRDLLMQSDVTVVDLEPETELKVAVEGLAMACPLVAGGRVLGILRVVVPHTLARYYLYNRVPMTLAHHAAIAFYAADLNEEIAL